MIPFTVTPSSGGRKGEPSESVRSAERALTCRRDCSWYVAAASGEISAELPFLDRSRACLHLPDVVRSHTVQLFIASHNNPIFTLLSHPLAVQVLPSCDKVAADRISVLIVHLIRADAWRTVVQRMAESGEEGGGWRGADVPAGEWGGGSGD
jgi:hypothetical protein